MKKITCINCSRDFFASPKHKNQNYCKRSKCQRAQKADWQRQKIRIDPEYKANQKLSNRKWRDSNPGYWEKYRKMNQEKAKRNRLLQQARNSQRSSKRANARKELVNMEELEPLKPSKFKTLGQYWLVPVIAKMAIVKANIIVISNSYRL